MANDEDLEGCLGGLLMVVLVVAAVMVAVMTLMSIGALFGAGTALRNYGLAFANNVRPQRAQP